MQQGFTIWFTGLSGAGKSTISLELAQRLRDRGLDKVELLDGDAVRTNLSKGLGFSKEDRDTNILRIGFVCELLSRNGAIAIAAAISPYREIRDRVRARIRSFVEVHVTAPLETLAQRDVKGLYKKALAGELPNFTGVSDPYEPPLAPEVVLETDRETPGLSVAKLLRALELLGLIPEGESRLQEQEEEKVVSQLHRAGRLLAAGDTMSHGEKEDAFRQEDETIAPHGGRLVNRFLSGAEQERIIDRIEKYPSLVLGPAQWSDVELIANGAYSPLEGFQSENEYRSIVGEGRLSSGLAWTIPILLLLDSDQEELARRSDTLVLRDRDGKNLALLHPESIYRVDKDELAGRVWKTKDRNHPGVRKLMEDGDMALSGTIDVIRLDAGGSFGPFRLMPAQTREEFKRRRWRTVAAFQTRNPVHRAHEYIQKIALELVDGLLLHPLVGQTKSDDVPAEIRMQCYDVLLKNYYPRDRVLLAVMPAAMRYAGPREAIHHAIIRQNYGCTHFIVGRDHAGVGSYYGTYDAQRIFDDYTTEELSITPLRFEHTFYCSKCAGMASEKTCPHGPEERIILSGSTVRERLRSRAEIPPEFSRPEVVEVLQRHFWTDSGLTVAP